MPQNYCQKYQNMGVSEVISQTYVQLTVLLKFQRSRLGESLRETGDLTMTLMGRSNKPRTAKVGAISKAQNCERVL